MEIPDQAPVMVLPNVTLFPQAPLPLHIFEPRYRQMLQAVLQSHRLFIVAMRKPGAVRDNLFNVAGLGLVRVCVTNEDGSSHLVLQGVSRVALVKTVQYRPYRVCQIRALETPTRDSVAIDALMAKVRDLVTERIQQELPAIRGGEKVMSIKEIVSCLEKLQDPDRVADLVSWSLLRRGSSGKLSWKRSKWNPASNILFIF